MHMWDKDVKWSAYSCSLSISIWYTSTL